MCVYQRILFFKNILCLLMVYNSRGTCSSAKCWRGTWSEKGWVVLVQREGDAVDSVFRILLKQTFSSNQSNPLKPLLTFPVSSMYSNQGFGFHCSSTMTCMNAGDACDSQLFSTYSCQHAQKTTKKSVFSQCRLYLCALDQPILSFRFEKNSCFYLIHRFTIFCW